MGFFDLHEPEDGQDRFFLYAMVIVPFCGTGSYVFDAWQHYRYHPKSRTYDGLLSTIVIVFAYLQYCTPIRSRKLLAVYFTFLCITKEIGTIGYLLNYIKEDDTFKIAYYICFLIIDLLFTIGLIYCRVINKFQSHIIVENHHLFHFLSRLEVLLTIFIPVFMNVNYTALTRHMIAHFLLFDFFSGSYERFQGIWIKSGLYLFAMITTVAVANEWLYYNHHELVYEIVSYIAELVGTIFCYSIIILQFFPFHFKTQYVQNIFREAFIIKQKLNEVNDSNSIKERTKIDIAHNSNNQHDEQTLTNAIISKF